MRKLTAEECRKVVAWQDKRVALGLEAAIPLTIAEQEKHYEWRLNNPILAFGCSHVEPKLVEPWITVEQILNA